MYRWRSCEGGNVYVRRHFDIWNCESVSSYAILESLGILMEEKQPNLWLPVLFAKSWKCGNVVRKVKGHSDSKRNSFPLWLDHQVTFKNDYHHFQKSCKTPFLLQSTSQKITCSYNISMFQELTTRNAYFFHIT